MFMHQYVCEERLMYKINKFKLYFKCIKDFHHALNRHYCLNNSQKDFQMVHQTVPSTFHTQHFSHSKLLNTITTPPCNRYKSHAFLLTRNGSIYTHRPYRHRSESVVEIHYIPCVHVHHTVANTQTHRNTFCKTP